MHTGGQLPSAPPVPPGPQCIDQVSGKRVLVVCSVLPWVEAIMLEREAKVWTTGFNGVAPIWNGTSTNPVTIIAPAELMRIATETKGTLDNGAQPDEKRFDALVCLGCVQHAGLGAYGEPIDPNGDVAMMKEMHSWTRPGGRLFLSLPTGDSDTIFFNKHRIYGKKRFDLLTKAVGWRLQLVVRRRLEEVFSGLEWDNQPLVVLKKSDRDAKT